MARRSNVEHRDMKLVFMALVMGLLIIISGIQAMELTTLKNKMSELNNLVVTKKRASGTNADEQEQSNLLQKNLQNLPGMVGGC